MNALSTISSDGACAAGAAGVGRVSDGGGAAVDDGGTASGGVGSD
jgi:hypothetical protein